MLLTLVRDPRFYAMKREVDLSLLADARRKGCEICGGALHSSNFTRKPRGGPEGLGDDADTRFSLCCAEDGCRTRHTPPSLRFLGRKVYLGAVVVLVAAMRHGATPARMRTLREHLGVSRRTVERWRSVVARDLRGERLLAGRARRRSCRRSRPASCRPRSSSASAATTRPGSSRSCASSGRSPAGRGSRPLAEGRRRPAEDARRSPGGRPNRVRAPSMTGARCDEESKSRPSTRPGRTCASRWWGTCSRRRRRGASCASSSSSSPAGPGATRPPASPPASASRPSSAGTTRRSASGTTRWASCGARCARTPASRRRWPSR